MLTKQAALQPRDKGPWFPVVGLEQLPTKAVEIFPYLHQKIWAETWNGQGLIYRVLSNLNAGQLQFVPALWRELFTPRPLSSSDMQNCFSCTYSSGLFLSSKQWQLAEVSARKQRPILAISKRTNQPVSLNCKAVYRLQKQTKNSSIPSSKASPKNAGQAAELAWSHC